MNQEQARRAVREAGLREEDVANAAGIDGRRARDWLAGARSLRGERLLRVRQAAWKARRATILSGYGLPSQCPDAPRLGSEKWFEHRAACPVCQRLDASLEEVGPPPSGDIWGSVTSRLSSILGRIPVVGFGAKFVLFLLAMVPGALSPLVLKWRGPVAACASTVFIAVLLSVFAASTLFGLSFGPWPTALDSLEGVFVASLTAVAALGLVVRVFGNARAALWLGAVLGGAVFLATYLALRGEIARFAEPTLALLVPGAAVAMFLAVLAISCVELHASLKISATL